MEGYKPKEVHHQVISANLKAHNQVRLGGVEAHNIKGLMGNH